MVELAIFFSVLVVVLGVRDVAIRTIQARASADRHSAALSELSARVDVLESTNLATRNNIAELKNFLNATRKR